MEKKTILLCDDDPEILKSVGMLLESAGYDVHTAHEYRELNAQLKETKPDLLVLDVRMPERDGFNIAESLQALGMNIPIIFMTGYDQLIYRLYAPFVGAVEFLIKPVEPAKLLNHVAHALA